MNNGVSRRGHGSAVTLTVCDAVMWKAQPQDGTGTSCGYEQLLMKF